MARTHELKEWQFYSPQIEEEGSKLVVTVHDYEATDTGYRREATPEETQQAILYWIADIHARIGNPT